MRTPRIKPTMPPTRPNDAPPIAPHVSGREEVRSRVPDMTRVYLTFGDDAYLRSAGQRGCQLELAAHPSTRSAMRRDSSSSSVSRERRRWALASQGA